MPVGLLYGDSKKAVGYVDLNLRGEIQIENHKYLWLILKLTFKAIKMNGIAQEEYRKNRT
jgi:hypothetical protein